MIVNLYVGCFLCVEKVVCEVLIVDVNLGVVSFVVVIVVYWMYEYMCCDDWLLKVDVFEW